MTSSLWLSFAVVSALNIVTPGPANLNVLQRGVQLGHRRVLPAILGNALGLAVAGAFSGVAVAGLVASAPVVQGVLSWAGPSYLGYLGAKLLLRRDVLQIGEIVGEPTSGSLFREALILAMSNPKAILFYLALFPQMLSGVSALQEGWTIAGLTLTYCALSLISLNLYAACAQQLRKRWLTQRRYDLFRQLSGLGLIGFAVKLFWRAATG
jgi:threonine/homoserine/homoserine lactone efflux protein